MVITRPHSITSGRGLHSRTCYKHQIQFPKLPVACVPFLAQLISCAVTDHPLGCGYWHCCHCCCWQCCGQKLTCKLYAVPGYMTKPKRGYQTRKGLIRLSQGSSFFFFFFLFLHLDLYLNFKLVPVLANFSGTYLQP